jgi:hypothetical protein
VGAALQNKIISINDKQNTTVTKTQSVLITQVHILVNVALATQVVAKMVTVLMLTNVKNAPMIATKLCQPV